MCHREKRNPFRVNEEYRLQPTQLMGGMQAAMRDMRVRHEIDVTLFMNELTRFAETELAGTRCAGFVCGGDMAKNWKEMFDNWDENTVAESHISVRCVGDGSGRGHYNVVLTDSAAG